MEQNLSGSGSDSDISEEWTLLNSEQDLTSPENGLVEPSDEDSVESFEAEKLEIPKREEESDGISIISESDTCDHLEAIPVPPQVVGDESHREYVEELITDGETLPDLQSTWRRRYQDSFSESDGCELAENLSLCPRKVKRLVRIRRPSDIGVPNSCDQVDDFTLLGGELIGGNKSCMRIYVHRPNDQINYILTILLALALAAVAGLGTGHFLGTRGTLPNHEETIYRLKLENQMLQNQLQQLLGEREIWRKISANDLVNNGKTGNLEIMSFEETKSRNVNEFSEALDIFNHTLIDNDIPSTVTTHASSWNSEVQKINNLAGNDKLLLPEKLEGNGIKAGSEESISKGSPKIQSSMKELHCDKSGACFGKASYKLSDNMKMALAQSVELSGKLKEALSVLDNAFANWKNLEIQSGSLKHEKDSFGRKAIKKLKNIFYDGSKTKKLITQTVDKLDAMKKKLFKKYDSSSLWEDSMNVEKNNDLKPVFDPSRVGNGPILPDELSSNFQPHPIHKDNYSTLNNDCSAVPDLVYGPQLPGAYLKSTSALCNIPDSNVNGDSHSVLEENSFEKEKFISKSSDVVHSVHNNINEHSFENLEVESQILSNDDPNTLEEQKEMPPEAIAPKLKKIPSENNSDKHQGDQPKSNKEYHSKQDRDIHAKKEKYATKEQSSTKYKETYKSDSGKQYDYERKKRQKEGQKFSGKESKGKKYDDKYDRRRDKYEKESKHKHKSKFENGRSEEHNKYYHKQNDYDSRKHFDKKFNDKFPKHKFVFDKNKAFEKDYRYRKRNNFKYGETAWSIDENGNRFTNISGDWLIKRNEERARQRQDGQKSDWLFERAVARKGKREEDREKARWYFQRARSRKNCRVEPNAEWCKIHDKKDSNKFDRGEFWKKTQQFNDNYYDDDHDHSHNYQKDWRTKPASKQWKGTKFISQAFKAAMNLVKA